MKMQLFASSVVGTIIAGMMSVTPASAFVSKPTATPDVVLVRGGNPYGSGGMQGNSKSGSGQTSGSSGSSQSSHKKKN